MNQHIAALGVCYLEGSWVKSLAHKFLDLGAKRFIHLPVECWTNLPVCQ
jgi:hypothetical protein